jgi:hypothetical protein
MSRIVIVILINRRHKPIDLSELQDSVQTSIYTGSGNCTQTGT